MAEEQQNLGNATAQEQHDREAEGLARELAGAHRRVDELKAMNAHPDVIADAEEAVENVTDALGALSGQKGASKRPRSSAKKQTR